MTAVAARLGSCSPSSRGVRPTPHGDVGPGRGEPVGRRGRRPAGGDVEDPPLAGGPQPVGAVTRRAVAPARPWSPVAAPCSRPITASACTRFVRTAAPVGAGGPDGIGRHGHGQHPPGVAQHSHGALGHPWARAVGGPPHGRVRAPLVAARLHRCGAPRCGLCAGEAPCWRTSACGIVRRSAPTVPSHHRTRPESHRRHSRSAARPPAPSAPPQQIAHATPSTPTLPSRGGQRWRWCPQRSP